MGKKDVELYDEDLEDEELLEDTEAEDDDNDEAELDRGDDFEDEAELDDDEDVDDSEEEEEEPEEEDQQIPRARLNEVIQQRNEERERTAWLEEQLEKLIGKETEQEEDPEEKKEVPVYDYEGEESKYIELIIEGETKEAARLRQVIDNHRQDDMKRALKTARNEAAEDAYNRSETSRDQEKFEVELTKAKGKYEFLDDESDAYNQEAVETINTAMAGFKSAGKSNSVALKMAVDKFARFFVDEEAPRATRKKATRKKAARASNQQPPKSPRGKKGTSRKVEDISVDKLSEREFNRLTEREKKILRGD